MHLSGVTPLRGCTRDQTSETITTTPGAAVPSLERRRLRRSQRETTVRPVPVVMDRVLPQDSLEVALAKDQEMVEGISDARFSPIARRTRWPSVSGQVCR